MPTTPSDPIHGPNEEPARREAKGAKGAKGNVTGGISCGLGCIALVFVGALLIGMGTCFSDMLDDWTRKSELAAWTRANQTDPDLSCRKELKLERESTSTPVEVEYRDTVPGAPFRAWVTKKLLNDGRQVMVYWPVKESWPPSEYTGCQSRFVEDVDPDGTVDSRPDTLVRQYHALLARVGRPHPKHPYRPPRPFSAETMRKLSAIQEWEECVLNVQARELALGETKIVAVGASAIECHALRPK